MSDRKCLRFFYDAFENGIESLDPRYIPLYTIALPMVYFQ